MKTSTQMIKALVTALAVTGLLTGCHEGDLDLSQASKKFTTYDVGAILEDASLSPAAKAEKLADIAERFVTPSSFMHADEILNLALKLDGDNQKARFYSKILAPIMELKGGMTRLDGLAGRLSPERYAEFRAQKNVMAVNKPVHDFFYASTGASISDERAAQALLDQVYARQDELRGHVRSIKRSTLRLKPMVPAAQLRKLADLKGRFPIDLVWGTCQSQAWEPRDGYHRKYAVNDCALLRPIEVVADSGDLEALQHVFAGLQITTIMATSYDATGTVLYENLLARSPDLTAQTKVYFLKGQAELGRLRANAPIRIIKDMGSDFYAGARWVQRYQSTFCPKGWNRKQREGRVFGNGLCVQDHPNPKAPAAESVLRVIEVALSGSTTTIGFIGQRAYISDLAEPTTLEFTTQANLLAPIVNPVADLKTILPTEFDRCGARNLGDATVGGLLPYGDGDAVATQVGAIGNPCWR